MTRQGNGQPIRYTVRTSEQTQGILKQLHAQAVQTGSGQRFLVAIRQIAERLQIDPLTFGEFLYRLPALKLLIYEAVVLPVIVNYAVHEDLPLVFIRGVKVLS